MSELLDPEQSTEPTKKRWTDRPTLLIAVGAGSALLLVVIAGVIIGLMTAEPPYERFQPENSAQQSAYEIGHRSIESSHSEGLSVETAARGCSMGAAMSADSYGDDTHIGMLGGCADGLYDVYGD